MWEGRRGPPIAKPQSQPYLSPISAIGPISALSRPVLGPILTQSRSRTDARVVEDRRVRAGRRAQALRRLGWVRGLEAGVARAVDVGVDTQRRKRRPRRKAERAHSARDHCVSKK